MTTTDRQLKQAIRGVDALLSPEVYACMFEYAAREKPGTVLEIGTAHGAGTIALALGCQSVGHAARIRTVDVFAATATIPSSRAKFGDSAANKDIVLGHFTRCGVAGLIDLFVGTSDDFAGSDQVPERIDMLVLDADGRIDRDLMFYGPRLKEDALVMIDDVDGIARVKRASGRMAIDLKHVISKKLLDMMVVEGMLRVERLVGNTVFCRAIAPASWQPERIARLALPVYRELVFASAPPWVANPLVARLSRGVRATPGLRRWFPQLRKAWRSLNGVPG